MVESSSTQTFEMQVCNPVAQAMVSFARAIAYLPVICPVRQNVLIYFLSRNWPALISVVHDPAVYRAPFVIFEAEERWRLVAEGRGSDWVNRLIDFPTPAEINSTL